MKRRYEGPSAYIEEFMANEYVSACITGTIQCGYPGDGKGSNGKSYIFDDYNKQRSGWWYEDKDHPHGRCGNDATITFNGNTGRGYEVDDNGSLNRKRPIYSITGFQAKEGTYTGVSWKSDDLEFGSGTYNHVGRLIIKNIDETHPNHS